MTSELVKMSLLAGSVPVLALAALAGFTNWNTRRAHRLVPPDGRFLKVRGARLHFVDEGRGQPIVMVHGLGGQLRNLTYALSRQLSTNHRVIVVDRPGSGYSTFSGSGPHGLRAQADIVVDLINTLGLHRPLLVGHSMGGAIALAAALAHPRKIGGLALLAPLTQPVETVPKAFAALNIGSAFARAIVGATLAAPLGRLQRDAMGRELFGPEAMPVDFDQRGGAALTLRPSAFHAASADVRACQEEMAPISSRYHELEIPVGIMFGRDDRILGCSEHGPPTVAVIAGSELEVIDGGHMFPVTQPEIAADWIRRQADRIRWPIAK